MPADSRPHVTILIRGCHIRGLLDSGASISCLGQNAQLRIQQLGLRMKSLKQSVQTADGNPQPVIGFVDADVEYGNKSKVVRFFVVPSLSQDLYLGIDFWEKFGLAPVMVNELSNVCLDDEVHEPNSHELSVDQQEALNSVKREFLSFEEIGLGKTNVLQHRIDVGSNQPIKQRHHLVSPAILQILNAEVDNMLSRGIIEESKSAWSSPVLVVKKPDGKKRFCLDCRAVNKVTVKDAYPMPIIEGIFANLHETFFISSIDLKEAFWQVELKPESSIKPLSPCRDVPYISSCECPSGCVTPPRRSVVLWIR